MKRTAAPYVGRRRELERLKELLGLGRIAVLVGEPGIGKTRTAQELADAARDAGSSVVWGNCYEGDWTPPFGPWAEVATQLVGAVEAEELQRRLGATAPALAAIVPGVRAALPGLEVPAALGADESRYRAYEAFERLLLEHEEPLVIVLDDLHWGDGESLGLLKHVARRVEGSSVVVLGTYRDVEVDLEHPLTRALADIDRYVTLERIRLGGLDPTDAGALVQELHGSALGAAVAHQIVRETGGNPFFIGEVVRHLLESGDADAMPDSVRHAVSGRVARLRPETATMLALASAFMGRFEFAVLQALSELPEQTLLDSVDEALRARLIRSLGEDERYEFAHALVRDALYAELSPSRKARLHRRIAYALEQVYEGREDEVAEELASQYGRSSSLPGMERGLRPALVAAEQARSAYAYEQGALFLRIARDVTRTADASLRADVLARLAISEAEALLLDDAMATARDTLATFVESGAAVDTVAAFLVELTWTLQDGGASGRVLQPLVDHGLRLLGDRRDLLWAKLKLVEYPIEEVPFGEFVGARWCGFDRRAVAIARASGDQRAYARTLETMEFRSAAEAEEALAPVRGWTDPRALVHGLSVAMRSASFHRGAFHESLAATEELLEVSTQLGSLTGQAYARTWEAWITLYLGDLERSRVAIRHAQELGRRLGTGHRVQFMTAWFAAAIPDEAGEVDWLRAARHAREICKPETVFPWMKSIYAAKAAACFARAGERAESKRLLSSLVPFAEHLEPWEVHYAGVVATATEAAWVLDDADDAERLLRLARRVVDAGVPEYLGTSIDLTFARLTALRGDVDEAGTWFERARAALEEQGQRPLRATVDFDEALMRHRHGLAGVAPLLDAAERRFAELDFAWWLRETEALRAVLREPYPNGLTRREAEILARVAAGEANREIAAALVLSVRTVERHVANAYRKIGTRNRAEATAYALRHGLST